MRHIIHIGQGAGDQNVLVSFYGKTVKSNKMNDFKLGIQLKLFIGSKIYMKKSIKLFSKTMFLLKFNAEKIEKIIALLIQIQWRICLQR